MKDAHVPLRGLDEATLREMYPQLIAREWKPGAIIFREGECCAGLHLVVQGIVKMYAADTTGREQIIHLITEPGPLSLSPLVDDVGYPASACAITPTRTLFLPRAEFARLFRTRPDFALMVARELAVRIRATTSIMQTIALKQVPARVASRIVDNARACGALESREPFRMILSQEEMARLLCTSRESVARAFGELRRAGIIEQKGSRVRILDPVALIRCIKGTAPGRTCATSQTEVSPSAMLDVIRELRLPIQVKISG
jgi:CRP-like cAMP-binding protein